MITANYPTTCEPCAGGCGTTDAATPVAQFRGRAWADGYQWWCRPCVDRLAAAKQLAGDQAWARKMHRRGQAHHAHLCRLCGQA
jgi:hypothetical protein